MASESDWYPTTRAGQRAMFANIDLKIVKYNGKYPFLTVLYLEKIHAACRTFIAGYDALVANRATSKQETQWFENLLMGEPEGELAPDGVNYATVVLPPDAFIGIEAFTRDFGALFKKQLNYDEADGLDLMIEKADAESLDLLSAQPVLIVTATNNAEISIAWKKLGFDSIEVQYRKNGTDMWQAADKSTVAPLVFAPTFTTPGLPEKFEVRAVYLIKNQRVGGWSPIYTVTVG